MKKIIIKLPTTEVSISFGVSSYLNNLDENVSNKSSKSQSPSKFHHILTQESEENTKNHTVSISFGVSSYLNGYLNVR